MLFEIVICLIVGYRCGCFSTGYFVGKLYHVDVRQHGSGNIGSTNTLRTLGKKAGIITLFGDVFKAIIPIFILTNVFKGQELTRELIVLYTGLGVVCGHNFPFWLKFKGGKGIASLGGVIIMFSLRITAIDLLIFLAIAAITKYVSLASLVGSALFPILVAILFRGTDHYIHMVIVSCIFTLLAFVKHRANIVRLLNGTENKLGQKAK